MFEMMVNGAAVRAQRDEKLIVFLRETLGLTSVKNGCSEGACGTCMVLVDGKATKACVLKTSKCAGKSIVTCEGLSPRERDVYAWAFTSCGAVQCGFCTPGMVISAKGLIDAVPDPTPDQVRQALKNNICRCTGYKNPGGRFARRQISARGPACPADAPGPRVGENMPRVDAPAKVLGDAEYADDMRIPGMLYGSAVRSAYPRARVLSIDVSKARALPGVAAVITPPACQASRRSAI